ncbi:MAG TPA: sigma-70 family RNA polymerase sigma factor [bacterium]|nr:sigma-70 family RNA polymerase sigma factor [bacterium]HPQ65595.1 sigma-70 family RNA polymerase sigma factor [bacterium]
MTDRLKGTEEQDQESDAEVIAACLGGEVDRYRVLVSRYKGRVYGMVYGIVFDHGHAEDIVQEAFIRAFRSLGGFRKQSGFYTWIYRIARNLAIDSLRRRRPEFSLEENLEIFSSAAGGGLGPAGREAEREELHEQVRKAMTLLKPEHREILFLREWEGMSYREISENMHCSLGTVMSRLHYARRRLSELLERRPAGAKGKGRGGR